MGSPELVKAVTGDTGMSLGGIRMNKSTVEKKIYVWIIYDDLERRIYSLEWEMEED